MNIGMILDHAFPPDIRVENEAVSLIQAGHKVFILCFSRNKTESILDKHKNIKIIRIYLPRFIIKKSRALINTILNLYPYFWAKHIRKFVKENQINIFHVHDLHMLSSAFMGNNKLNLPIIADLHENYPAAIKSYNWANSFLVKILIKPGKWEKFEADNLGKVSKIILLSKTFKKDLLKKYSFLKSKNIVVYPNVPNLDNFNSYPLDKNIFEKKNNFILFYFGVVAERRGIFTTFEMMKLLKNKSDIKLLIIGPVDAADKQKFADYLSDPLIKNRIIYFPWRDIKDLPSFIYNSDVCLSPILKNDQHDSGVANKVFQYMLFGKPVVVSDSKEQQDIIKENKCGLVHIFDDPQDLADKILSLYNNPKLCEEMGHNGRNAILNKYNTTEQSKEIINMYGEFADNN